MGLGQEPVLIVDNERENWLLERLLRDAGIPGAVSHERSRRPHFIWMDLLMPMMDGFEATQRIRALEGGGEVKANRTAVLSALELRAELRAALIALDQRRISAAIESRPKPIPPSPLSSRVAADMPMPEIDDLEVRRRLKAQEQSRDIPPMFISAASDSLERMEGWH